MLECSICLDSMTGADSDLSSLGCGHLLHSDCLAQHLNIYPRCPICSAPSYPNDPSIRRIFLAAPEERTPPPEVAAEVEVARLEAQLRQQEVRYDTLVAEQEAADRSAVAAERAKRTAEDNLRTSERTKNRYQAQRDVFKLDAEDARNALTVEKLERKAEVKTLQARIKTLESAASASAPAPNQDRTQALALLKRAREKRVPLTASSSVEPIGHQPLPGRARRSAALSASSSRIANAAKGKKRTASRAAEEDAGSTTEDEVLEEDEIVLAPDPDDGELEAMLEDVEVLVHWSGRGSPSIRFSVSKNDTIKTFAKRFLDETSMKATSFRGPNGTILDRIADKKKTVQQLGIGPDRLDVTALVCIKVNRVGSLDL